MDTNRIQAKLSGFERYGAMYEDERLLMLQDQEQRAREQRRASKYVEAQAETLTNEEEGKLAEQEAKIQRQEMWQEASRQKVQQQLTGKAQELEEQALIGKLDHLREQRANLEQIQQRLIEYQIGRTRSNQDKVVKDRLVESTVGDLAKRTDRTSHRCKIARPIHFIDAAY